MSPTIASLSLDLDDKWAYLKARGDGSWESFPSILDRVVPRLLEFLADRDLRITFFIVGQDAALQHNRALLQAIADAGHEVANHSFHHEPWLAEKPAQEIAAELQQAEEAILQATGQRTLGFRGPAFSRSPELLSVLVDRGYQYDASSFPTFIGPLARAYFMMTAKLDADQRSTRSNLYGSVKDGFATLRPHEIATNSGPLCEIPVTTMPLTRAPIHLSYLFFLAQRSPWLARAYFHSAIRLCRWRGLEPSLLLHALDFWGCDDDDQMGYFPGMGLTAAEKMELLSDVLETVGRHHRLVTMDEHASRFCRHSPASDFAGVVAPSAELPVSPGSPLEV